MLIQLLFAFVLSLLGCGLLVRFAFRLGGRYPLDRPQRFHMGDVPRLGGVAMGAAFLTVGTAGAWLSVHVPDQMIVAHQWWPLFALAMGPAWLLGIAEDYCHTIRPAMRLAATVVSAVLLVLWLDLRINRLGLPWLDHQWIRWGWAGVILSVLAIASMAHAFNIIDGYNGLASTVTLMITAALIYVAVKVGDWHWLSVFVTLFGVTLGFWLWNYPRGLLFAGDGGAYLWGMVIAAGAIGLVQRNPIISPWFPVLLLAYPIMETLFSAYRKLVRGQSPSVADALHFHQLIYRRIVRGVFDDDHARQVLMRNNRTSPYLWGVALLAVVPAVVFWSNSVVLMVAAALFTVGYVAAYLMIVRFKVPRWIRRS